MFFKAKLCEDVFLDTYDMSFDNQQSAYQDLRSIASERTQRLVAWTGAGLSAMAGLPSWASLRLALTEELARKIKALREDDRPRLQGYLSNAQNARENWDAFRILRKGLGETTYQETIRRCLRNAHTCEIPILYGSLWKLGLQGIINLNIDKLASRAFSSVYSGSRSLSEFNSLNVGGRTHVLQHPSQAFIYNAHGIEEDASSWVFTREDLNRLFSMTEYLNFVNTTLSSFTVVFVGISAEDQAAGGHLQRLLASGINVGSHYWITDRRDSVTDKWAEKNHLRIIRYENSEGAHSELREIFNGLLSYFSEEEPVKAEPVHLTKQIEERYLPGPDELISQEPEMIRLFLNAHAQEVLSDDSQESYDRYRNFSDEYDLAIHQAWYVGKAPKNVVLGYVVEREEARGAFGRVYKAKDEHGRDVALKVLLQEVRTNPEALASFRRGVGSMKILKKRRVEGMVEYFDAAEIPAMVVMEWIDGADLRRAVAGKELESWEDLLRVASELSAILREAHGLPERVLHRDLRPANIMLDGLYQGRQWIVKVLDFDLSWHRGSNDRTLVHQAGTTGYLAPEQIQRIQGVSTRHSAVDSFGLGMTIFFMVSGRDPLPDQHKHRDWEVTVKEAAYCRRAALWNTVPARVTRLIIRATQDEQSRRPDMTAMNLGIDRLYALSTTEEVGEGFLDLVAEEIATRSTHFANFVWSEDDSTASLISPSGLTVELRANESRSRITFTYKKEADSKRDASRRIAKAVEEARMHLSGGGWRVTEYKTRNLSINIVSEVKAKFSVVRIIKLAQTIDKACDSLNSL